MMRGLLIRFLKEARGIAATEFAIFSALIMTSMLMATDFALYAMYESRLNAAVSKAGMAAFANKDAINTTTLSSYVTTTAGLTGLAAPTITCNGSSSCVNTSRPCGCLSGTNNTYTSAASCTATCTGGNIAGYYLTVSATYTYSPIIAPNSWFAGRPITAQTTVRLQ